MSRDTLEYYKEDNFSFLEKIRSIHTVNRIPVTLSMGIALFPSEVIAAGKANFSELATKARAGLDLALGRGGDQVVVYEEDGSPHFYGGKTRCVEKNTRVRARVVAQAIHELIDTCDMVLVMGHEREDYDSIGAAVGVAHMARLAGKPVHVVVSNQTDAIRRLENQIMDNPDFKDLLISAETAENICNSQTLLFIVDTHRPDMTVAPALLEETDRRVVIDHHRRSSDFIKKPLLTYTETSSSSTSELVTELLQYFQEDVELSKIEATASMPASSSTLRTSLSRPASAPLMPRRTCAAAGPIPISSANCSAAISIRSRTGPLFCRAPRSATVSPWPAVRRDSKMLRSLPLRSRIC